MFVNTYLKSCEKRCCMIQNTWKVLFKNSQEYSTQADNIEKNLNLSKQKLIYYVQVGNCNFHNTKTTLE
jgi:hypothetical protein